LAEQDKPASEQLARGPELLVAGVLLLLAVLVISDSLRVGIGWAPDGPRAGYFPFYIGLGLAGTAVALLASQLLRWRQDQRVFAENSQLASVWMVFWPMVAYVGLITLLGIYASSVLLILYFMRRHGRFGWLASVLTSLIVMACIFGVFELWFMVPLPKGPLEALVGL
jgi:putative tricarboxylic transport membrane protein